LKTPEDEAEVTVMMAQMLEDRGQGDKGTRNREQGTRNRE